MKIQGDLSDSPDKNDERAQLQADLLPGILKAVPEDSRFSHMYCTEIKLESKKKEIESYKIYFGKHSADIVYQYKYIKLKELEIQNEKLRILATRDKVITEPSELSSKVRAKIYNEILQSTMVAQSLLSERTEVDLQEEKESTNTLSYFLPKLNLEPNPAEEFIVDLFHPNRHAFELSNRENLRQWLHGKEKFISYNYAQAILTIDPKDFSKKTRKNEFLRKGVEARELDCVCLYIYYLFKTIRAKQRTDDRERSVLVLEKNRRKFEEAYNLLSETIILNGLMVSMEPKDATLPFLQFYYVLLDVYIEFRDYCYQRLHPCLQFITGKLGQTTLFDQEVYLLNEKEKAPQLVRDLSMFMVTEYDITHEGLLRAMNLFEYLCNSSEQFYYLGLFLGDMYDQKLFGAFQGLDEDKRMFYYEAAERVREHPRIALLSKARLNIMYQAKLETFISPKLVSKEISNDEVEKFYLRILNLNKNHLMDCYHPSALYFYALHYLRCGDFKIIRPAPSLEDIFPIKSVVLNREAALLKAQVMLNDLSVLGEAGQLELYYRVLKYLRFEEVYEAALKIAGDCEDEKLMIPLAFCKEKGIGGPSDLEFALSVYLNSVNYYSEQKEYYRLSLVLYRIGILLKRGGWHELGLDILKASLRFCLKVELTVASVDKRFLFHLATVLEKIDMPDKDLILRELLIKAYQLYPTTPTEYIVHYEIERKIEKSLNRYKSRIKTDLNMLDSIIKIQTSFSEEFGLRQKNQGLVQACIGKLQNLRAEFEEDLKGQEGLLPRIKEIEKSGENCALLKSIDPSLITVQNELLTAVPEDGKHRVWAMRFEFLKTKRQQDLGALSMEKSAEGQMQYLIDRLTTGNPHAKEVADSEVERLPQTSSSSGIPKIDSVYFEKVRFLVNNQLSWRIVLEFDALVETKYLIDNFNFFQTFNPFFLNYLGICYRSSKTVHSVQLYSEYFDRLGSQFKLGFVNSQEIAVDMVQKMIYQCIHAVRSLHIVGRVCFFVSNKFLAVTSDFNVHLVCPFWKNYFSDPHLYLGACLGNGKPEAASKTWLQDIQHFPPEAFHLQDYAPLLKHATKQFDLLDSRDTEEANLFRLFSSADVWALGLLFFQLLSSKPFYDEKQFRGFAEFKAFCGKEKEVEKHAVKKIEALPSNLPPEIRQALQGMLRWNPLKRVNIGQVLSKIEAIVFNKIYRIEAVTLSEVVRLMFQNVYYEPARVMKIEQSVEKLALILPKGYLFEGDCVNGVPNGDGVIKLKGKAVLKGRFKEGRICAKTELQFGEKDTLRVEEFEGEYPKRVVLHYDKNLPTYSQVELDCFEANSWLPKAAFLKQVFDNFSFDSSEKEPNPKKPLVSQSSIGPRAKESDPGYFFFKTQMNKHLAEFAKTSPAPLSPKTPFESYNHATRNLAPIIAPLQPEVTVDSHPSLAFEQTAADDALYGKGFSRVRKELDTYLQFIRLNSLCYDIAEDSAADIGFYVSRLENQNLGKAATPSKHSLVPGFLFKNPLLKKRRVEPIEENPVLEILSSEAIEGLIDSHEKQSLLKKKIEALGRYPTIFLDPFGNVYRMFYDRVGHCVEPRLGIMATSVEAYKSHHITVFQPETSTRQVFISRLNSFSVCDSGRPIRSFGDLSRCLSSTEFGYSIITEVQSKQFRGEVNQFGPVCGRLFLTKTVFADLERAYSEGSYKGIVMDRKNNIEYEGGIKNLVKQGFGKLKYRGALRFVGQFRDGIPHGKGLLLGESGTLKFKGVFANGSRRFGTSMGPDRKEAHGLHFPGEELAAPEPAGPQALDAFVRENIHAEREFRVVGCIKQRRKLPVFYCNIRGWEFDFTGDVKAELGGAAYFYGSYEGGLRMGLGLLKQADGSSLQGWWCDTVVKGECVRPKALEPLASRRDRRAWTVRKGLFRVSRDFCSIEQFGLGTIMYLNGAVFTGEIRGGQPNGYGKKVEKKTIVYRGQFVDGEYQGVGQLSFKELRIANEGNFVQGNLQGIGIFSNDSQRTIGVWEKVRAETPGPSAGEAAEREKHYMRFSYSQLVDMRINGFYLASIQSQVEYNEFSFEYSKIGLCSGEFRKVFSSEGQKAQVCSRLLMFVVEAALQSKLHSDSVFKIAQETIRRCVEDFADVFLAATETTVFRRYSEKICEGIQAVIDRYYPEYKGKASEKEMAINLQRRYTRSKWRQVKMKSIELDGVLDTVINLLFEACSSPATKPLLQAAVEELAFGKLLDERFADEHPRLREAAYQQLALRLFARQRGIFESGVKAYLKSQSEELKRGEKAASTPDSSRQYSADSAREPFARHNSSGSKEFLRKGSARSSDQDPDRSNASLDRHSGDEEERPGNGGQEKCPELLALFATKLGLVVECFRAWVEAANEKVPDSFEGQIFNNEVNGIGSIYKKQPGPAPALMPEPALLYRGEFRDGFCTGLGVQRLAGDAVFRGVLSRGEPSGWGEFWAGKSTCFLGNFAQGKRVGVFVKLQGGQVAAVAQYSEQEQPVFSVRRLNAETDCVEEVVDSKQKSTKYPAGALLPLIRPAA